MILNASNAARSTRNLHVGMNSESGGHQYRFDYNAPNVAAQRAAAMQKSHMGDKPYNDIDDVSSGKYFGDVK